MKKLIGAMMLIFCFIAGISNLSATVETFDESSGTGTIGPGGKRV